MGILQFSLIRPYYRDSKLVAIEEISNAIQSNIIENDVGNEKDVQDAFQVAVNNNVCVLIFNEQGKAVYQADGLGGSCIFSRPINIDDRSVVPIRSGLAMTDYLNQNNGEFSKILVNDQSQQEMILYGRKVSSNLGNFYLFTNSPLEPIDSLIIFLQDQYIFYVVIIMIMTVVISLFISNGLSKPIVKMKSSADQLASSNYSEAKFEGSYFKEIDDLAKTLNSATEQLSRIDELRRDLIANMSHDIKTPLTMIKAYAEMIQDISGENTQKREEHLEVIIKEVDYLDHLVTDMQELSKMQSGNYELNLENFDIVKKTKDVLSLFKVLAAENNIEMSIQSEESIIAYGDSIKLGQVIYNFLSNAIKHSEENKPIMIRIQKNEEVVRFEIQDEAGGIPEDKVDYIWDRYYKIDKSFRRSSMGTGLGLAIVKAILDNHHASYGVQTIDGKGSLFWFEISQDKLLKEIELRISIDEELN